MKIRLMTFHTPKNYGAVLQAYSLFSYLKTKSEDVKVIDYNTEHLRSIYPVVPMVKSARSFASVVVSSYTFLPKWRKFRKFEDFVENNLCLTKRYNSTKELYEAPPEADIIFTGSDQVFGPNRIEDERKAFYLDFVDESVKTASYAASFGVKHIPEEKKEEITGYLKKFDYLSVREKSGVDIIKQCICCEPCEVLDPVFLNSAKFWRKNAKVYKRGFDNYIFYYRLMNNKKSDRAAKDIAAKLGKKVVVMTDGRLSFKADKVLRDVGPQEFLYLMGNAEYIITDSFHGVAFSLIFEKQFAFVDFNESLQQRAMLLMQKLGISEYGYGEGEFFGQNINYEAVNDRLNQLINDSKEYINEVLESVENC